MTDKTGADLISEAKSRVRELPAAEVKAMLGKGEQAVCLDVREANEFNLGHLPGALHIPRGSLELRIEGSVARDATMIVYCATGVRSALAVDTLQQIGYANAHSLAGGWREWVMAGGPVEE